MEVYGVYQSDMSSEFKRYATFNGFATPPGVWPLQLAQSGFYRSVCADSQVICFACGLPLDVRTLNKESVMAVHRRKSPKCSFVAGSANNQPVPAVDPGAALEWLSQNFCLDSFQDMETDGESHSLPQSHGAVPHREDRTHSLPTFTNIFPQTGDDVPILPVLSDLNTLEQPGLSGHHPAGLSSLPSDFLDGFQNTVLNSQSSSALFQAGNVCPPSQLVSSSLGGPGEILLTDGEALEAVESYPAPLLTETQISSYTNMQQPAVEVGELGESGVAPQKLTYIDLGIIVQRPKREEYATYNKRLETFNRWMGSPISQTRETIAEAGFYYAGYSDCCRCFYCGGGLKSWECDDHPWVEHARWFKDCPFVLTNKGKDFVEAVQSLSRTKHVIHVEDVRNEMTRMGVPYPSGPNDETICSSLTDDTEVDMQASEATADTESELNRLAAENDDLKGPGLCKICRDEDVSIVYLPCGHLVTCGSCAPTVKNCPICRQTIQGQVRIQRSE